MNIKELKSLYGRHDFISVVRSINGDTPSTFPELRILFLSLMALGRIKTIKQYLSEEHVQSVLRSNTKFDNKIKQYLLDSELNARLENIDLNVQKLEWEIVESQCKKLISQYPKKSKLYHLLFRAFTKQLKVKELYHWIQLAYDTIGHNSSGIVIKYCWYLERTNRVPESLEIMDQLFQKNPTTFPKYLKKLIQYNRNDKLQELLSDTHTLTAESIDSILQVFNAYLRIGEYNLIVEIISKLSANGAKNGFQPFLYAQIRLLAWRIYNILTYEKINLKLLLTEQQRKTLLDKLNNIFPDPIDDKVLIKNIILNQDYEIHSKNVQSPIIEEYLTKLSGYKKNFYHTKDNPAQAFHVADFIRNRIKEGTPTSFIRLGDGEGTFLPYPKSIAQHNDEDRQIDANNYWGKKSAIPLSFLKEISAKMIACIHSADIVGIIPPQRILLDWDDKRRLDWNYSKRGVLSVMNYITNQQTNDALYTSAHIHQELEQWNLYPYIFDSVQEVTLISAHKDLILYIKKRFGIRRVNFIKVVDNENFRSAHNSNILSVEDEYKNIQKILDSEESKNKVFILAAGLLSRIYSDVIKKNGGISIDIGSVADDWIQKRRRGMSVTGFQYMGLRWELDVFQELPTISNKNLVSTNMYTTREIRGWREKEEHKIKFLMMANPRTGSRYSSQIFSQFGFDIGHEYLGKDGMVSWVHTAHNLNTPDFLQQGLQKRISRYDLNCEHLLMMIREPLATISSMIYQNRGLVSFNYRRFHIWQAFGVDIQEYSSILDIAVASYLYWVDLMVLQKPEKIFKLETIEFDLKNYFIDNNITFIDNHIDKENTDRNETTKKWSIQKKKLGPEDFVNLDASLKAKLIKFCTTYEYDASFIW